MLLDEGDLPFWFIFAGDDDVEVRPPVHHSVRRRVGSDPLLPDPLPKRVWIILLSATRPICDNGWLPMERQVGSSGQTVAPKMYLAVGISGAIQHLVGMKGSRTVVAINKDENAPIFETADYAVIGDLFEIVPALVEEIKKVKAQV